MDDDVWLDPHGRVLHPAHRGRGGSRAAGAARTRSAPRAVVTSACLAAIIIASLTGAAWAQPDVDISLEIPLHPRVPTMLQLPDAVEGVWITHRGEIRVAGSGSTVYIRPRPGTRAGVEGVLEVKTATMRLMFRLRVVKRAREAREEIVILAINPEQVAGQVAGEAAPGTEATPDAEPVPGAGPAPIAEQATTVPDAEQATSAATQSAASKPTSAPESATAPAPAPTEPAAERDTATDDERDAVADTQRDTVATGSPRFELSVHAVVALAGNTTLRLAGYEPEYGRRAHRAFAMRLVGARPDAWWALQARVGMEWPAAPLTYARAETGRLDMLHVSGPWVQADLEFAARLGRTWMPTIYAGIGVLAHLRRTETTIDSPGLDVTETTRHGAVLTLGMGLQRRVQDLVLGLDFQTRYGVPDEYHSMAVFGTVGWVLDQGE